MLRRLLNHVFPRHPQQRRGRRSKSPSRRRLFMEPLEQRTLLSASPLDLTTAGACGEINGAIFQQVDPQSTGTGVLNSFVRMSTQGAATTEEGYDTDYRPLGDDPVLADVNSSPQFTHSLRLSDVPVVNIGGCSYREFVLDVNEEGNGDEVLVSLDALEIYLGSTGDLINYPTFDGNADLVYDLDAGGDSWIKLDFSLNSGSGSGDMLAYVPDTLFAGSNEFVYLYSRFGDEIGAGDGFEEWGAGQDGNGNPMPLSTLGEIHGYKFNDLNGNGVDDGEPRLDGVTIFLDADGDGAQDDDEASTVTGPNGEYAFTNLVAGLGAFSTYRVREVETAGMIRTTENPPDLQLGVVDLSNGQGKPQNVGEVCVAYDGQAGYYESQPQVRVEPTLAFGNVLQNGDANARTLGFWANKNGQKRITDDDLAVLAGLNLVDQDGNDFDPASKGALREWLLSGHATNMAYMLSVQLAAMQLNVLHGFVDPGAHLLVTNPDGTKDSSRTVSDIISEANAALADQGLVLSDSPDRPYFESLKNALDDANNNLNFVMVV